MSNKWKIISFFTEGTPYKNLKDPFVNASRSVGVDPHIYTMPDKGNWIINTHQKLLVIQQALKDYPQTDIVWTDIDSRVVRYPSLFDDYSQSREFDACFLYAPHKNRKPTLTNGTMWFANNEASRLFIEECIQCNTQNLDKHDQHNMAEVLRESVKNNKLLAGKIPWAKCCIFDRKPSKSPCIIHYQASRRFKKIVNKNGKTKDNTQS